MEYFPAIKQQTAATWQLTWVNRTDIILSDRSQTQKTTYYIKLHLYEVQKQAKPTYDNRGPDSGSFGQELLTGMGHRSVSWHISNVLYLDLTGGDMGMYTCKN